MTSLACRDEENTAEFRTFRKQAYHASIARIFAPLRAGMTTPEIVRCPDKHYRQAIYELGPFIADYPEQVVLAGIVQGWCPKSVSLICFNVFDLFNILFFKMFSNTREA